MVAGRTHQSEAEVSAAIEQGVRDHDRRARARSGGRHRLRAVESVLVEVANLAGRLAQLREVRLMVHPQEFVVGRATRGEIRALQVEVRARDRCACRM